MHRGNRLADGGVGHANPFVCGYPAGNSSMELLCFPDLETFPKGKSPLYGYPELPCDTWGHLFGSV
ncbi:MAG: hypothetical protein CM15mP49_26170 [Actinomycetota bacterium]|nr:MAG: hypothetical protein CM15mP49_26170 [Actinomycetota bacterium]